MLDTMLESRLTTELPAALRPIPLDDDVSVWCGCASRDRLAAALEFCRLIPSAGKRWLVLWAPQDLEFQKATNLAWAIATAADQVIVVGEAAAAAKEAVSFRRLQADDDPRRAVIASLQLLGKGQTLILLAPDEGSLAQMRMAAETGSRWRGGWDEAEGGELHLNPRSADLLWQRI